MIFSRKPAPAESYISDPDRLTLSNYYMEFAQAGRAAECAALEGVFQILHLPSLAKVSVPGRVIPLEQPMMPPRRSFAKGIHQSDGSDASIIEIGDQK